MKLLILCCFLAIVYAEKARFDNYRVFSLKVVNKEQLDVLYTIENDSDGYLFWNSIDIGRIVDIMVPPHKFAEFSELADAYNIEHTLKVDNVQT